MKLDYEDVNDSVHLMCHILFYHSPFYLSGCVFWGLSETDELRNADGVIGWIDSGQNRHFYDLNYNSLSEPNFG